MLMLDSENIWYLRLKTSMDIWNQAIIVVTDDVKNSPVFTDL